MKAGDLLLFKEEKGISKIISWSTNSPYSHVAICVSPDMNLAIEAIAGHGVRAINIKAITSNYDVFRIKDEYTYSLDQTIAHLVNKLNLKYDYLGVLWLGILKLFAKLKIPIKNYINKWQKQKDYFCSELCYEAFHKGGGLDIVPDVDKADITSPADISKSNILDKVKPQ